MATASGSMSETLPIWDFQTARGSHCPNHDHLSSHGQFASAWLGSSWRTACLLGAARLMPPPNSTEPTVVMPESLPHALAPPMASKWLRQNGLRRGPFRGVCAWDANLPKRVVLVDAVAGIEHGANVQDVGRTHHADVEVVGLDHVFGHALNVLDGDGVEALQVGLVVVLGGKS